MSRKAKRPPVTPQPISVFLPERLVHAADESQVGAAPPPIRRPKPGTRFAKITPAPARGPAAIDDTAQTAEGRRLAEDAARQQNWKRWGPYLAERQWATVREDYSANGDCWEYFPHDHARSRAYRWGEDGLLGWTDRECRLCFGLALWNEKDPILKERLFGLTNSEGNHGEDVKEFYYYLDSTPTHSFARALYKYPQAEFPYDRLVAENRARGVNDREFEITDTGVFDDNRYFDVFAEFAKAGPNDTLIRLAHRQPRPRRRARSTCCRAVVSQHLGLGLPLRRLHAQAAASPSTAKASSAPNTRNSNPSSSPPNPRPASPPPEWLFTENETNSQRLFGIAAIHALRQRRLSRTRRPRIASTPSTRNNDRHQVPPRGINSTFPPAARSCCACASPAKTRPPRNSSAPAFDQTFADRESTK